MPIEFGLLGPLEIVREGRVIPIEGQRKKIFMAMLLLEAGHVVSVSRLVDAIWGESPPQTAKEQVQITVSALRRAIGTSPIGGGIEDIIVTRSPGYLLHVPGSAIDHRRFESLVAESAAAAAQQRPHNAVELLREALGLWRGPAADGIESHAVQAAATQLNERRLAVLRDRFDLELQLGRNLEVTGELTALTAQYPLHEPFRAQLMLALYRGGRQAEALEVFQAARETLREQLGLDPGEDLRRLEQAILARDRRLDGAASAQPAALAGVPLVPRQLPRALPDLVGREESLERIRRLLSHGDPGSDVTIVTLSGRGGSGKTALALRAAHLVREGFPDGQLFVQLHGDNRKSPADLLDRLLRSVGIAPDALPGDLESQAAMYRSWLAERRVLMILDDVASITQVLPLLPGIPGCAVIITTRARLHGLQGHHEFEIEPLDEPAALKLLAGVIRDSRLEREQEEASRLIQLCEGIPLALHVAAAKLAARPHWRVGQLVRRLEDEEHRLDELVLDAGSVRATLLVSYESLDGPARRLFRLLGLIGAVDFAFWAAAPLLDRDPGAAEGLLEDLVAARLVESRVADDGSVRFHLHDLVRIFAQECLVMYEPTAERVAAIRRLCGCWLSLVTEAHRRVYGGDSGLVHGSAEHWSLPRDVTDSMLADPAAWLHGERTALVAAISHASRAGLDEICWDLATTSVTLFESGARAEDWRKTHEWALSAVRTTANRRGEAALLASLGTLELTWRLDVAIHDFKRALEIFEELDDPHGRALARSGLAFAARLDETQDVLTEFRTQVYRGDGDTIAK